jgi:hypothetical protein
MGFGSEPNPRETGKKPFGSGSGLDPAEKGLFRREKAFSSWRKAFPPAKRLLLGVLRLFQAQLLAGPV